MAGYEVTIILSCQCDSSILSSMDLTSGVVLDVGYGIVTCAAMWRGEECPKPVSCDPGEATSTKLAEMVHEVVSRASKDAEMESTLKEHIVVTGINDYVAIECVYFTPLSYQANAPAFTTCRSDKSWGWRPREQS